MDATQISDEACERLLSGHPSDVDIALADLSWFLQDLKAVFCEPVPMAAKNMHPAAVAKSLSAGPPPPKDSTVCKPSRSWWYSPKAAALTPGRDIPKI